MFVPVEHDPLRNRYNALLRLIQSGELREDSVISVGHYDYGSRLEMFAEASKGGSKLSNYHQVPPYND